MEHEKVPRRAALLGDVVMKNYYPWTFNAHQRDVGMIEYIHLLRLLPNPEVLKSGELVRVLYRPHPDRMASDALSRGRF